MTQMILDQIASNASDTLSAARGHGAGLARVALAVQDGADPEERPTPSGTLARSAVLDGEAVRATLTALALAKTAGRLEGLALALRAVSEEQVARHAVARAEVEAEAERDVGFYIEDHTDNPATCPTWEQWCRDAFAGQWQDEWIHSLWAGAGVPRDLAELWHRGAFELVLGRLTGAPVGAAGVLSLAQREVDARALRESDTPTDPTASAAGMLDGEEGSEDDGG